MFALCAPFIVTFPDLVPKFTISRQSLRLGNVMTIMLGSDRERGFHQQEGPKGILEGRQLRGLMGMVVETRDWGYQRR